MFLDEKIKAYLAQNNISFGVGDYQTGQPQGQNDQILDWDESKLGPIPTQEQLDAAWAAKEAADVAVAYKALRASEYPSFADQFDLLYHGGFDAWKAAIQSVKDKYPKG
jgi:hypothetical protein